MWGTERLGSTSDLRPLGGVNFDSLGGSPGTLLAAGTTWAIPSGKNGRTLKPSDLLSGTANYADLFRDTSILPRDQLNSAVLNVWQNAGEHVSFSLDALIGWRRVAATHAPATTVIIIPSTSPFFVNPTADDLGSVSVMYGFGPLLHSIELRDAVDSGQATAGARFRGLGGWRGEVYAGRAWSTERQIQSNLVNETELAHYLNGDDGRPVFDPFADPSTIIPQTIDAIRSQGRLWMHSDVTFVNANAQRSISWAPNRTAELSAGAEVRGERFRSVAVLPSQPVPLTDSAKRTVAALFGEIGVPLFKRRAAASHVAELSTGLRYEHYGGVGGVMAPRVGLALSVWSGIRFRSTWAGLFRASSLEELSETANVSSIEAVRDPNDPDKLASVLVWAGNNANLKPERARTWTLGVDWTPDSRPEAAFALTYFDTVFSDRIGDAPDLSPNILTDQTLQWTVDRNVTQKRRADICGRTQFLEAPSDCLNAPISAIVDLRVQNIATLKTRGLDLNARYAFQPGRSSLAFGLLGTYLLDYSEAETPTDPLHRKLNTPHYPIDLRFKGSITWKLGGLAIGTTINYQHGYRDTDSEPNRSVRSWTTADLVLGYGWPGSGVMSAIPSFAKESFVGLRVSNVLNSSPPFLNNVLERIGYDQENGNLLGRIVSLTVRERW